ncbi:MAG: hypothetical protein ACRD8O_20545 [Bryobacteraceae bacterium]
MKQKRVCLDRNVAEVEDRQFQFVGGPYAPAGLDEQGSAVNHKVRGRLLRRSRGIHEFVALDADRRHQFHTAWEDNPGKPDAAKLAGRGNGAKADGGKGSNLSENVIHNVAAGGAKHLAGIEHAQDALQGLTHFHLLEHARAGRHRQDVAHDEQQAPAGRRPVARQRFHGSTLRS